METTVFIQIEMTVEFDAHKAVPKTRDYPGDPAEIEINDIKILNCEISEELHNNVLFWHEDEIKEHIGDEIYAV